MEEERNFMQTRLFWRYTFIQPKLGPLDYRAIFVIMPFLFYIRVNTLIILGIILMTMFILQKKKVEPDNIIRWMRAKVAGDERTAQGIRRLREPVDYGFETQDMVDREVKRQIAIRENRKSPKYKGRKYANPATLGPSMRIPLRERFTVVRQG